MFETPAILVRLAGIRDDRYKGWRGFLSKNLICCVRGFERRCTVFYNNVIQSISHNLNVMLKQARKP